MKAILAVVAIVLVLLGPGRNLWIALSILIPTAVVLYGTALILWWRQ